MLPVVKSTQNLMLWVLFALCPGIIAQCIYFGTGYLGNLLISILATASFCLLFGFNYRASVQLLNFKHWIRDWSNWITCALIALALPPETSPFVITIAVFVALGLGKYAYGGLGRNPFNPAMVGYVFVLLSFPEELAQWSTAPDALTSATPLELHKFRNGLTTQELWADNPAFGWLAGHGWEWINCAYLLGGIVLLSRRIITWHIPAAMLGTMVFISLINYDMGSSSSLGSPTLHLFSGGTLLAAFFVATDPVTCPAHRTARLIFGALIGLLTYVIRVWGAYPDGIAFAVLLANVCVPLLDHVFASQPTRPATNSAVVKSNERPRLKDEGDTV